VGTRVETWLEKQDLDRLVI